MNNITIQINKLGAISNIKIELAPVMIFTGTSNLGKSYTNFLIYYVLNLFSSDRLNDFFRFKMYDGTKDKNFFQFTFTQKELCEWMREDVKRFFNYLLNYPNIPCDICFDLGENNKEFTVSYSEDMAFKESPEEYTLMVLNINGTNYVIPTGRKSILRATTFQIAHVLSKEYFGTTIRHAYLLPPGRASILNESFSTQVQSTKTGMYDIFMRDFDRINNLKMNNIQASSKPVDSQIIKAIANLIDGELTNNKEGLILKLKDNTEVPLSATASSIKELTPLLLWMQTGRFANDSMCIEEPEAHTHPDMQYKIADLLALCIEKGVWMQITTHSDYLLARLNQLIRLHDLKVKNPNLFKSLTHNKNIDTDITLDKEKIKAYYFYKNNNTQTVCIEKQDLTNGIPFSTFTKAVQEQIDWDSIFESSDLTE